jgi:transketolase
VPGEDTAGAPDVVLLSSGSEVAIILEASARLAERGVKARVVSMPCHETFADQPQEYRESVLPVGIPRVSLEAAHPMSWQRWVAPDGIALGLTHFGESAPYQRLYEELGVTAEAVVEAAEQLHGR